MSLYELSYEPADLYVAHIKEGCEMIKKILVPLDASNMAENAIPVAAHIARNSLCSVLLIRVADIDKDFGGYMNMSTTVLPQGAIDEEIADATSYLTAIAKSPALTDIKTETSVFTGSPAAQIIDVARVEHADLIIMCSHGETGIKRWTMGNVAHKVMRHSSSPVLVLRSGKDGPADLGNPQSTKPLRVLVTLDGSPFSETVLEPLVQLVSKLAISNQCHINLLRVVDMPNHSSRLNSHPHIDSEMLKEAKVQVELYMQVITDRLHAELARLLPSANFTITSSYKIETDVPGTIINVAEHGDTGEEGVGGYDLIAMATHGRSALPRWTLGSVTERVLDSTKLPLLIVRPRELQV